MESGVPLATADDLRAAVRRRICCRIGARIRDFEIDVTDSQVILRGRICSFYVKQLATHAVLNEIGDRDLINELDVDAFSYLQEEETRNDIG
jgi:hypothetical protein